MKKNTKILIGVAISIVLVAVIIGITILLTSNKNNVEDVISLDNEVIQNNNEEAEEKGDINIFKGNDRPIAVMIDNHKDAMPQANLNKAYIVYEIIVEGGETRLMALYKGQDLEKIGPIRSSRHYFLDYALENDAIYVHYGWSPRAKKDISKLSINNINGLVESSTNFWRVSDKSAPHNAVSASKNILSLANAKGYRVTSDKKSVLNYISNEVNLENGQDAQNVYIKYSNYNSVQYTYYTESKTYQRYSRGTKQVDWDTKEDVTTKNIIVTFVKNTPLNDGSGKDRQNLENIGTFDGYYITNGKAMKIKCEKKSREEQTVYKDLNGEEIKVNDGNTFIQICPIDGAVNFDTKN